MPACISAYVFGVYPFFLMCLVHVSTVQEVDIQNSKISLRRLSFAIQSMSRPHANAREIDYRRDDRRKASYMIQ